jgi:hypothetical protein
LLTVEKTVIIKPVNRKFRSFRIGIFILSSREMFVIRRNVVYVGGLAEQVGEELLHAAFIPFGDLKSIQIPRDYQMSKWISFFHCL